MIKTRRFEETLLAEAKRALARARTLVELKHARELAQTAVIYARRLNGPSEVLIEAACLAVKAERAFGVGLKKHFRPNGNGRKLRTPRATLQQLGISKPASHRAQLLATLSARQLNSWLRKQLRAGQTPSVSAARRYIA